MERFDITEMIRNMVESSKILVEKQEVKIIFDEPETHVWADEFMIEEVVNNYLSNARKSRNEMVDHQSQLLSSWKWVRIKVFNTGDHIPQEDIDKLWVKFYKVDKARTREYGGSGIGLSIVEATMKAHGKDYGVANVEGGVEILLWCGICGFWICTMLKKHFHCVVYGSKNATDKEMSFVVW